MSNGQLEEQMDRENDQKVARFLGSLMKNTSLWSPAWKRWLVMTI